MVTPQPLVAEIVSLSHFLQKEDEVFGAGFLDSIKKEIIVLRIFGLYRVAI